MTAPPDSLVDELLTLDEAEVSAIISTLPPDKQIAIVEAMAARVSVPLGYTPAQVMAFIDKLIIPSQDGVIQFSECMAPFQRERFEQIIPSIIAVSLDQKPPCQRFYWEATKGAAKDADLAILLIWLLLFSQRPLEIQVGAADRDQASIVKKRIEKILYHNRWIGDYIKIQRNQIKCEATVCTADVIAADVDSAPGEAPDVVILNELHVTKEEFANELLDNADKVKRGLVVVATNSGFVNTWQHRRKRTWEESDRWTCNILSRPSDWTDAEALEDAKQRNSHRRFQRLWWGVWGTETGEGFDVGDVEWCLTQHAGPIEDWDRNWDPYVAGLDFGLKHDHAALVVLGCNEPEKRFRVAYVRTWKPEEFANRQISHSVVQHETWEICKRLRVLGLVFDPWQFVGAAEWLASQSEEIIHDGARVDYTLPCFPFEPSARNKYRMCHSIVSALRLRELEGFPCQELEDDFHKSVIEDRQGGSIVTATSDAATGHADRLTALMQALPWAEDTIGATRR